MDNDDLLDDDDELESIDTVWMYFDASGKAVGYNGSSETVVKKLSYGEGQSGYFMFNNEGYMLSGWKERDGDLYYLGDQNEGWARTGWQQLEVNVDLSVFQGIDEDDDGETVWFYFKPNGKAYTDQPTSYNGKTYVFDQYGRMLDLWAYKDGSYTNDASSSSATTSDGKKYEAAYYADSEGGRGKDWVYAYPTTNYEEYDDDPYWFWLTSKGIPFKADEQTGGVAKRVDDTAKISSADADDPMYGGVVAAKVIKNSTYLFNDKGVMMCGLFELSGVPKGGSWIDEADRDPETTLVLVNKSNTAVVKGKIGDRIMINGYGRIKTSGTIKDINGDSVSVGENGVVKTE